MAPPVVDVQRTAVRVEISTSEDVVVVRQRAREHAQRAGFSLLETTKLVTAASELARNTLDHGGGGYAELAPCSAEARIGVQMTFVDEGPGIPDVPRALQDGFSTGKGLGLGLSGSRRLLDVVEIESSPGRGTRVRAIKWR